MAHLKNGRKAALALLAFGLSSLPSEASPVAISSPDQVQGLLNMVWVMVAAALVMVMQIGFLLLEAGMVRSKNSINVAMKNIMDFAASVLFFAVIGFMLAFGASSWLPVGFETGLAGLRDIGGGNEIFFLFQAMFCGTAATIVSGAVAERMRLSAYVLGSIVVGALVYPVFVHWSWGAALQPNSGAFLGNAGYVDFAGSTVVHALGGWLSLAACIVLGARRGRFRENGEPVRFSGHSPVLAGAGTLMLYIGWIGFNGGSTGAASTSIGSIVLNTILAGSAGCIAGYLWTMIGDRTVFPEKVMNGLIAGLVAVTAGCHILDPAASVLVGLAGASGALWFNQWLEHNFRIDDAVGAIGVHGFAGVLGALLLAVLAPQAALPAGSWLDQLGIQLLGCLLNFAWAFGTGFALYSALKALTGIRVKPEAEEKGLNENEHSTRIGIGHIEEAMGDLVSGTADLSMRLPVEGGDEAERLTRTFNALMENMQIKELEKAQNESERRTAEEAERFSALANATFEALCIAVDGKIVDGNAALCRLTGLELDSLRSRPLQDFMSSDDIARLDELSSVAGAPAEEFAIVDTSGETIPVEVRSRDMEFRGVDTRVLAIVDLRERKKAEARIRHLALHDPLTGLPNRALFNDRLTAMIDRTITEGSMSAVVLIDLDRFKDVNDLHGHAAGDQVLKVTAERIQGLVGHRDTVARLGGDEFAVLQLSIDFANQAEELAIRLVEELSKPIELTGGQRVRVGTSVGVAFCPRDGIQNVGLVTRADTALYHAKNTGRNRYAIFEHGMDEHVRLRQLLELDLSDALEEDQFDVHYQPRLSLATGEIVGYEALVRWHHPTRGMVSPAEFIPVAEGCGQIVMIGEWVLQQACSAAARHMDTQSVSVNASPVQFRDHNFVEAVRAALQTSGLDPARLEIEITESVLIAEDERALGVFRALKRLGVKIALDDFGTGYSSLSYLSRFPFDTIKIDQSFVQSIGTDENSMSIVETIIRLGRSLNMTIVAEGVEAVDDFTTLIRTECHEVQGFLVGAAQPQGRLLRIVPDHVAQSLHSEKQLASLRELSAEVHRKAG
ncbi:ammonium transporter [Henriciella aquimarina]|uniref:ammonium transporter n=1 Tax=Henriciella aquimarina TaxID=545261 RepID=UPI001F3402EB|nr:ammonium transporter [Henriciella aquimarina]